MPVLLSFIITKYYETLTIREYIAKENLSGVQNLARKLSQKVPQNEQEANQFLRWMHFKNPEKAEKVFKQLHPDRNFLSEASSGDFKNMIAEPLDGAAPTPAPVLNQNQMCGCGSFKNAVGLCPVCSMRSFRNAIDESTTNTVSTVTSNLANKLETYADKGVQYTEKAIDRLEATVKEKNNHMVQLLVAGLIGIAIGKFILK